MQEFKINIARQVFHLRSSKWVQMKARAKGSAKNSIWSSEMGCMASYVHLKQAIFQKMSLESHFLHFFSSKEVGGPGWVFQPPWWFPLHQEITGDGFAPHENLPRQKDATAGVNE